jgi:hypothetical protein
MTPRELSEKIRLDTVTDLSRYTSTCLHGENEIHCSNSKIKFMYAETLENDNFSDLVIEGDEGGICVLGPTSGAMRPGHSEVLGVGNLDISEHSEDRREVKGVAWCGVQRYYGREGAPPGLKEMYGKGECSIF